MAPHPPDSVRSPRTVLALLSANGDEQETLWSSFVEQHSRLIMHACRSVGSDHDAVMDRYTYVLEQLRQNDYERLRAYSPNGRGKFTTWLTVVVRRLGLDYHRSRYGRTRGKDQEAVDERKAERRRLVDLISERIELERIEDGSTAAPDAEMRRMELRAALTQVLAAQTPRDRLILAMRFEDDLTAREIAEVIGLPSPFHVYRQVNHILARLKRMLASRGIEDPEP